MGGGGNKPKVSRDLEPWSAPILYHRVKFVGARKDVRNAEGKLPYDMAAKYPDAAKQLKVTVMPAQYSADYGDEEDSD